MRIKLITKHLELRFLGKRYCILSLFLFCQHIFPELNTKIEQTPNKEDGEIPHQGRKYVSKPDRTILYSQDMLEWKNCKIGDERSQIWDYSNYYNCPEYKELLFIYIPIDISHTNSQSKSDKVDKKRQKQRFSGRILSCHHRTDNLLAVDCEFDQYPSYDLVLPEIQGFYFFKIHFLHILSGTEKANQFLAIWKQIY